MQSNLDRLAPYRALGIADKSIAFVLDAEESLIPMFQRIEAIEAENTARVLGAFQREGVAQRQRDAPGANILDHHGSCPLK